MPARPIYSNGMEQTGLKKLNWLHQTERKLIGSDEVSRSQVIMPLLELFMKMKMLQEITLRVMPARPIYLCVTEQAGVNKQNWLLQTER